MVSGCSDLPTTVGGLLYYRRHLNWSCKGRFAQQNNTDLVADEELLEQHLVVDFSHVPVVDDRSCRRSSRTAY